MVENQHTFTGFSSLTTSEDGLIFRDLNKNGVLDIYEDPRQPVEDRVEDLLSQMTLEEKAGTLFINGAVVNPDGSIDELTIPGQFGMPAKSQIEAQKMNHFNMWEAPEAPMIVRWHNNLQQLAEETRLGIPITLASDPRNHFSRAIYEMAAQDFSQWCQPLGFGAIGDPQLVKQFADIARREYLAVGIRVALHPQIDLATEPRWSRIAGTFGEDAQLTARLAEAYIMGFQGEVLGAHSVACMAKHFPGGGPQAEGLDSHFPFHKGQIYPGNHFDYHLIPFEAALRANTAAIMPYYGIPVGQTDEDIAMGFNQDIITGLLREKYHYDGLVCTDWGLITDVVTPKFTWPARAWGVEELSEVERTAKIINAGCDMFGGESCPQYLVAAVNDGLVSTERLNQAVRRSLKLKFRLGLFDNPFVDPTLVGQVFYDPTSLALGLAAQSKAITLLKNEKYILPLQSSLKIYVENIDREIAGKYTELTTTPEDADITILRLSTPWQSVDTDIPFARGFHHGDLDFKAEEKAKILHLMRTRPTVVIIELDRPAVIPEIATNAAALLADFGASDKAVLDVVFGKVAPQGRLPFELPSSMDAVRAQFPDVPYDSANPLYHFGFGLDY